MIKVGDEVRVLGNFETSHEFDRGQVVEVTKVFEGIHKGYYRAKGRNGDVYNLYKSEIKEMSIDNRKN